MSFGGRESSARSFPSDLVARTSSIFSLQGPEHPFSTSSFEFRGLNFIGRNDADRSAERVVIVLVRGPWAA